MDNLGKGLDIDKLEDFTCDCGSKEFIQVTMIKKVPGVYLGAAGETVLYPVPVLKCYKCGKTIDIEAEIKKVNAKSKTGSTLIL